MMAGMNSHPFAIAVNLQCVTIQMIIGRNEVHILVGTKEIEHLVELVRKIDIIILCEVNKIAFRLLQQNLDLLPECRMVAHSGQRKKNQIFSVEIFLKKSGVLLWTSVEQHPKLDPQPSQ